MLWIVPERVLGIELGAVGEGSLHIHLRVVVASQRVPTAQDFETPELSAHLGRLVVRPGEDDLVQRLGRFLACSFAGERAVAHRHRELIPRIGVARGDVGRDALSGVVRAADLLRQVFHFPAYLVLLVDVGGAQLVELADFGIDFYFLHHGRIAGRDGLDFGVGERSALQVFGLAHGDACRS